MNCYNDIDCRICLEKIEGEYIKPCNCIGGIYHKSCLEKWIATKDDFCCEICLSDYNGIYLKYVLHSYYFFNSILGYFATLCLFLIVIDIDNLIKQSENNISKFVDLILIIFISIILATGVYIYYIYKYRLIWEKRICYSPTIVFKA